MSTDASIDLFATLNGTPDAGGTWTGPSTVVAGQFDPATNTAGVYTYTIAVPPPCVSVSSTVTITLVQPPNAGTDGSLTLCISSPATSLFTSLNGSPNAGGTWSGPSPVVGGQFDPATMTAGDYLYTVNGTAPCPSASATVSVSVATNPDPGTPGAATLCSTDASIDLFATLNGTPMPKRRNMDWTKYSSCRTVRPSDQYRWCIHLHDRSSAAMCQRFFHGDHHTRSTTECRYRWIPYALHQQPSNIVVHFVEWQSECRWNVVRSVAGRWRTLQPSDDDRRRLFVHRERYCTLPFC
ncbi:MAG: hypothetical protein IPF64_08900 [Flavobacteriales bacterium]|nr:hypothetical protein [Flavobacteriales bacterium]